MNRSGHTVSNLSTKLFVITLIPAVLFQTSLATSIEIINPNGGEPVQWRCLINGNYLNLMGSIYVLISPQGSDSWEVQPTSFGDGLFSSNAHIGTPNDMGNFDIIALMTTRNLASWETISLPDPLPADIIAKSRTITVSRIETTEDSNKPNVISYFLVQFLNRFFR